MSNFAVWKDVVYTANVQDLRYYVKADGETIYQGRAKADPSGTVRINVRNIVKDWLDSNIRDYLPMSPDFVAHPEALRVCGLYDAETDTLLAEYNVLFNFDTDWNGEDLLLQNPVNTHADPRQKIFATYGTIDPDGADPDIDIVDLYWFDADDLVTVRWNAGEANVPVNTNYPLNQISVVVPAGVRLRRMHQTYFEFEVPENLSGSNVSYTVEYWRNGSKLDETTITVGVLEFVAESPVTILCTDINFNVNITTNLQTGEFTAVAPEWLSVVELTSTHGTFHAEYNFGSQRTGTITYYSGGHIIGTTTVTQEEYVGVFRCEPYKTIPGAGGLLEIAIETDIDLSRITVGLPTGWTLVSLTPTLATIMVPGVHTFSDTDFTVTFYDGQMVLGYTQVTQEARYYFNCDPAVVTTGGNFTINVDTNVDMNDITVVLPAGFTLVSKSQTEVVISVTAPSGTSIEDYTIYFKYGDLVVGSTVVTVYSEYAGKYLEIGAENPFTINLIRQNWDDHPTSRGETIWCSIDGGAWVEHTVRYGDLSHYINIPANSVVRIKSTYENTFSLGFGVNASTGTITVSGNIMSLYYGDNFIVPSSGLIASHDNAFRELFVCDLFYGGGTVIDPSNFVLPAHTIGTGVYRSLFTNKPGSSSASGYFNFLSCPDFSNLKDVGSYGCYGMFQNAKGLHTICKFEPDSVDTWGLASMFYGSGVQDAGRIVLKNVSKSSCDSMFARCEDLTVPMRLIIQTLGRMAFAMCFVGCTSLEVAPEIPDAALLDGPVGAKADLFRRMFLNCTNLRYVKSNITNYATRAVLYEWLSGVASTGTFVKVAGVEYRMDSISGIPSGWTVQEV